MVFGQRLTVCAFAALLLLVPAAHALTAPAVAVDPQRGAATHVVVEEQAVEDATGQPIDVRIAWEIFSGTCVRFEAETVCPGAVVDVPDDPTQADPTPDTDDRSDGGGTSAPAIGATPDLREGDGAADAVPRSVPASVPALPEPTLPLATGEQDVPDVAGLAGSSPSVPGAASPVPAPSDPAVPRTPGVPAPPTPPTDAAAPAVPTFAPDASTPATPPLSDITLPGTDLHGARVDPDLDGATGTAAAISAEAVAASDDAASARSFVGQGNVGADQEAGLRDGAPAEGGTTAVVEGYRDATLEEASWVEYLVCVETEGEDVCQQDRVEGPTSEDLFGNADDGGVSAELGAPVHDGVATFLPARYASPPASVVAHAPGSASDGPATPEAGTPGAGEPRPMQAAWQTAQGWSDPMPLAAALFLVPAAIVLALATKQLVAWALRSRDPAAACQHPVRRAMLQRLLAGDACSRTELAQAAGKSVSTVRHHLRILQEAGFVQRMGRPGTSACYALNHGSASFRLPGAETGQALHVLRRPWHRAIYETLCRLGPMDAQGVTDALGQEHADLPHRSNVSRYASQLVRAGLVRRSVQGGRVVWEAEDRTHQMHGHVVRSFLLSVGAERVLRRLAQDGDAGTVCGNWNRDERRALRLLRALGLVQEEGAGPELSPEGRRVAQVATAP